MVEITIDGKQVEVPDGSMVMHAAQKAGLYVPHFCYHKKLSIAANCRMCLVEVEKAPKALPACATPCSQGMVVHTQSEKAVAAQKSVMEFLLINHPLDCPICDQGGECQLQDLAVGYGGTGSRYAEEKRVVMHKPLGSLISAQEMARCIQCTRCVRFGQEVAGVMELGMLNRGEHSEITSFVGRAVESELSGNMIDVCPVGALTSKPFRYAARTWELARRKSVSPHDSVGTNIVVQVKNDEVLRVVPYENDDINECWISDKDRFSYEALNSSDRLTTPMIRNNDGSWRESDWSEALSVAAAGIHKVLHEHGPNEIGGLSTHHATLEEFAMLAKLVRTLKSDNIDFRLRLTDPSFDSSREGTPWLGMPINELGEASASFIIGSSFRKDHPLFAQRLRQATKKGMRVYTLDAFHDDPLFNVAAHYTITPSLYPQAVAEVLVAVAQLKNTVVPDALKSIVASDAARVIADGLVASEKTHILVGNAVAQHPHANELIATIQALAEMLGAKFGYLTEGANTVGGYMAQALPQSGGKNAIQMLRNGLKAFIVLHAEPHLDAADGQAALKALKNATFNLALTSFKSSADKWAHVMLPIAPFTETSGTFVNAEGRPQSFKGTVKPLGATRPAWKVLRVLGNTLNLDGFDDETSEAIRDQVLAGCHVKSLSNHVRSLPGLGKPLSGLERVTDIPIYFADSIVRRADSLQQTSAARHPVARLSAETWERLGLQTGQRVRVKSFAGSVELDAVLDSRLAARSVRISAAHESTVALGGMHGELSVERVLT